MARAKPTEKQFTALEETYEFFNSRLFDGKLPPVLLNFARKHGMHAYFAANRWARGERQHHEIVLNPEHLTRDHREIAATVVHEMVHLWQAINGTPGRRGYHNVEWANKMESVGLMPSTTGKPGGARTGERCSHYIIEGGPFAQAYERIPARTQLPYVGVRRPPSRAKVLYLCPSCGAKVWGKAGLRVACIPCCVAFVAQD